MSLVQPFEHTAGLSFDSTNFTMCNSSPSLLGPTMTTSMDEWEEDKEEKDDGKIEDEPAKVVVDPDLEDGDEEDQSHNESEDIETEQDEDEFEQYLFGDDDE